MNELTPKQETAIKNLQLAIKECGKLKINLAGFDDNIIYATRECQSEAKNIRTDKNDDYSDVAAAYQEFARTTNSVGVVKTGSVYLDSGGW